MIDVMMTLGQMELPAGSQPAGAVGGGTQPAAGGGGAGVSATSAPAATGTTLSGAPTTDTPRAKGPLDMLTTIWPFILIFGVLYLFLFKGQRKEEKNRKKMVEQMKRGDEVMTIGGLVGKVVEVKEDRVVIKVDETTNVKETYLKSAIQRVLTPGDKGEKGEKDA